MLSSRAGAFAATTAASEVKNQSSDIARSRNSSSGVRWRGLARSSSASLSLQKKIVILPRAASSAPSRQRRRRNDRGTAGSTIIKTEIAVKNDSGNVASRARGVLTMNKAIFDSRDEDKEMDSSSSSSSSSEKGGTNFSSSISATQQQPSSSPTALLKSLGAKDIVDASRDSIDDEEDETNSKTTLVLFGCVLLGILACSVYFRESITETLFGYASYLDSLGPINGPLLFAFGYFVLEMFAVPAFPLTMSAGALFGAFEGTLVVVSSATAAAVAAFLISRYVARDAVKKLASEKFGDQYRKIDEAIGENGFGVVFMLRLSPLLPFSVSNYLYGLTSVSVLEYAPASFLGMIPGTAAYVASGDVARTISSGGGATVQQLGPALLGLGLSALSAWYVGRIASKALCEDGNEEFCEPSFDEDGIRSERE